MARKRRKPRSVDVLGRGFQAIEESGRPNGVRKGVISGQGHVPQVITKTSEEKDHATFSASGAERWLNCPGSIALSEKAPPARESEYAAEGTEAHACLEFLLKNRVGLTAAISLARAKYPEDMIEHAIGAVAWVLQKQEALRGSELAAEMKVDSSSFTMADQFGTLDVQIVQHFGRLVIVDYKYGAGVVRYPEGADGRGDPQLVYYALAVAHAHDYNFADVELVVIQPRAWSEDGETVRSHLMSIDELLAWRPRFLGGVEAATAPDAPTRPGAWCKFCNAATICPSLKEAAFERAKIVFSDIEGVISVPTPRAMKLPHLSQALGACSKLEAWIKKVREHAYHVLESGGTIDGYKLVQKKSPRRWKDPEAARVFAVRRFGTKVLVPHKLQSPAQLEKVIGDHMHWAAFLGDHVTSESSGTTLVESSDKRPAVKPIDTVFTELPAIGPKKSRKGK